MSAAAAAVPQEQQRQQLPVHPQHSNALSTTPSAPSLLHTRIISFILKNHLALGIVLGVFLGALYPPPGRWLSTFPITTIAICFIFVVQGLRLDTQEAKRRPALLPRHTLRHCSHSAGEPVPVVPAAVDAVRAGGVDVRVVFVLVYADDD